MPHKKREEYNAYLNAYMQRRYYERKKYGLEKLGGVCVECGETESLDFDHIDPTTKILAIGKMWSVAWPRFVAELEKCQLLCQECHKIKTKQEKQASIA